MEIKSENFDLPEKEPEKKCIPIKEAVSNWNNKSEIRELGIMAVSKRFYYLLWIFLVLFFILFSAQIVWSNLNGSFGKYADNTTLINNVESSDVNPNFYNYNNYTVDTPNIYQNTSISINIPTNLSEEISNKIINYINSLNLTNSS
jgi:hypothetical protein